MIIVASVTQQRCYCLL